MTRSKDQSLALALLSGKAVPAFALRLAEPANENQSADHESPARAPHRG